jgi:NADPH:quinone reductase-like Zn-dependent oxidoreductase
MKSSPARALGADHLINYRTTPAWGATVQDITGHRGADGARRTGHPGPVVRSVGGHIALIGVLTGFEGHVPTHLLMSKQARLQGLVVGHRQQQDYVNA